MNMGLAPATVRSMVVLAKITLCPEVGSVKLAVAVDDALLPARVAGTVVRSPFSGVSVTWTTVPTGRFAPWITTLTGSVCAIGSTMSGMPAKEPVGEAGAAIPATDAMINCGAFGKMAGFGCAMLMADGLFGKMVGL